MIDQNDLAHPENVPHAPRYYKAWQARREAEQAGLTGRELERLRDEELRLRREVINHALRHTPDRMRTSGGRNQYVSAVRLMQRRNT